MEYQDEEVQEEPSLTLKVCVVGAHYSGRTSFVIRASEGVFPEKPQPSMGPAQYAVKDIRREPIIIRLNLWDVSSVDQLHGADCAVVVHNSNRPEELDAAAKWKSDINAKCVPAILVAARSDEGQATTDQTLEEFCRLHGFVKWFRVSSKSGEHVDESLDALVNNTLRIRKEREAAFLAARISDPVKVDDDGPPFTLFKITAVTWEVDPSTGHMKSFVTHKRFNDFVSLHSALEEKKGTVVVPPLPERRNAVSFFSLLGRFDPDFLERRRFGLQSWINAIIQKASFGTDPAVLSFLQQEKNHRN